MDSLLFLPSQPFDQKAIIDENAAYIKAALGVGELSIMNIEDGNLVGDKKKIEAAVPGKPSFHFYVNK